MSFPAKYPGFCRAECGNRIQEGDLVEYADDELVHADCSEHETPARPETICQNCCLAQPCDCEAA